jgi:serine protease Do
MRIAKLLLVAVSFALLAGLLHAKPDKDGGDKKIEKQAPAFKPVEFNNILTDADGKDPKLDNPSKKYTVKLNKDKTYIIDLASVDKDFDPYLRLLDRNGKELAEDDDGGGDLNSRIIFSAKETSDHDIIVTTFDGQVGKFNLKVREYVLKGEAKPRDVGDNGLSITAKIEQADQSNLGKLAKRYSIAVKAGQTYTIDLESQDIDCYMYLFDNNSKLIAQDDDSGGDLNSRITFRAPSDGVYHIIATSLDGEDTGEFTLKVRKGN